MKAIATCDHIAGAEKVIAELTTEFGRTEHEGRFIQVVEFCPRCWVPMVWGDYPEEAHEMLIEGAEEIWRGKYVEEQV